MTKSILIGDSSQVFRRTTRGFIERHPQFGVCGEAIDGLDAVDKPPAPSGGLVPSRLFYLLFTLKPFVLKTFYLWALMLLFLRRETYRC